MVTSKDCMKKYGPPENEKNMVVWKPPIRIQTIPLKIYCNRDLIVPLHYAIENAVERGLSKEIKTWDGCYSGDTEYFTGEGWKRIDEYDGGLVGQVNEDYELSLTEPENYLVEDCEEFIKLHSNQGVSQLLSEGHRVIYFDHAGREIITTANDLYEKYKKSPHIKVYIPSTFKYKGNGIDYSDDYIRLKVAVFADGCFPNKSRHPDSLYCRVYLSKKRKINRLREILQSLEIPYKESVNARTDTTFSFYMDNTDKHFNRDWYQASYDQLKVICNEVNHWDACITNKIFFSTNKESVDFIQYARGAIGIRSKVKITRIGKGNHATCYGATSAHSSMPDIAHDGTGITKISIPGGKKYCFTVQTGRLLMRHNGHVFVSGNCFNIRSKRGGTSMSLHSWGIAIDINAAWNRFGQAPTMSKALVKCFVDAGFDWGGYWDKPDGQHFQLSRLP